MTTKIQPRVALVLLVIVTTFLISTGLGAAGTLASVRNTPASSDVKITVTDEGFRPAIVVLRRGAQTRITFVRQTENTCATAVVVQELGIDLNLPLNEPVSVEVTPQSAGQYNYGCGTGPFNGTIMVR